MEINYAKNQITLYGKVCKLDTLIKKLSSLSGEQVYHFLIDRSVQLPRRLNSLALISVLNDKIKFLHSNSLSKDYFAKLQYYSSFSEQQLFNLFMKVYNEEDFLTYRKNLVSLIIDNYQALNLNDGELMYLKNLGKQKIETFPDYFNFITGAALEENGTFDGQFIDVLKDNLQYSASNQDIMDLEGKYGVSLPTRLKREEYLEFIIDYLKRNGKYSDVVENELSEMNITQVSTYARRMGIPMQPNMSKQELITYLFYFLDQCEIPSTSAENIKVPDNYKPLEFKVDLSVIDSFGNGENKKVIFYQNDQADEEKLNAILQGLKDSAIKVTADNIEDILSGNDNKQEASSWKILGKTEEENVEEVSNEEVSNNTENVDDFVVDANNEENNIQENLEDPIEKAKAEEALLAEDIINETLAQIKEKQVIEEEIITVDIDTKKVDLNPYYESSIIYKSSKGKTNKIALSVFASLGLALAIASLIIFLIF